jgi:hypothetical protein
MSETAFCYHCGVHHSIEEMRQILTKAGKRRRCIKSIDAAKVGIHDRDAFGLRMTEINKAEKQARRNRMANPELDLRT